MKIAIIIERADISLGGAERSIFELANALSLIGHQVDILAAIGQANAKNIHVLCTKHNSKRIRLWVFAKALNKHFTENHYDIIHSVLPFNFADIYQPRGGSLPEAILRNAASYQNRLLKFYKRFTAFANFRRTTLLRTEKKLCKDPDGPKIAALSNYVAQQFSEHYGLGQPRVEVIANGIKILKTVNAAEADRLRAQILTKLKLREPDYPAFFLFVANNFRLKGLACLIKALRIATDNNPSRRPYLIVAGRDKSHKYRVIARKLNVHKQILFLGKVRHIQNAISIIDVAVLPTFYDPASRYILEALAADKPVITTKFNGAADLFIDGRHGRLIDTPTDTPALADAIHYFTDTANIQKAAEAIAADNIEKEISINRVAKQLTSLYTSILEKRRK